MSGAIHPLPQYAFMAWCLVKHRDNFTFYLYTPVYEGRLLNLQLEDSPCRGDKVKAKKGKVVPGLFSN
jgi:hypothetical protein